MRLKSLIVSLTLLLIGAGAGAYAVKEDVVTRVVNRAVRLWQTDVAKAPTVQWKPLPTALHVLEEARIPVASLAPGGGGVVAAVGDHLLVVGRRGIVDYLAADGTIQSLGLKVPMKLEALLASDVSKDRRFRLQFFRVHGLLALKSAPDTFDLLVSHHRFEGSCIDWVISRVRLRDIGNRLEVVNPEWEEIFKATPCIPFETRGVIFVGHQAGGKMVASGEDKILFSVGDHRFDGVYTDNKAPMDPNSHLGKIILLDLKSREAEIFASGLRNPQGLVLAEDGRIWETEHGPRGGDEVNLITRGGNYGWPEVTYGLDYPGAGIPWPPNPRQGRHDGYAKPKFAFVPSVGLSDLIEVRGAEFPRWEGDLLATSIVGKSLFRLRIEGDAIVYAERIEFGERLRNLVLLDNGQIAVLTRKGDIIFIRTEDAMRNDQTVSARAVENMEALPTTRRGNQASDSAERGKFIFDSECGTCHALTEHHEVGPHLVGVIGRKAGSLKDYAYSPGLKKANFSWDRKSLGKLLSGSGGLGIPNAMPPLSLTYDEREDLIAYFRTLEQ